jgi:hypothetical protein
MGPEMAAQSEFQESADSLNQNFGEPYFATKVGLSRNYGTLFLPISRNAFFLRLGKVLIVQTKLFCETKFSQLYR